MGARSLGVMVGFLGILGLALPFFGLQLKILNLFVTSSWLVALGLCVVGGILFMVGKE